MTSQTEIFYFTPIASPFQLEFVDGCNKCLPRNIEMVPVFINPLPLHRKHWGEADTGINLYNLTGSRIFKVWRLLVQRQPSVCILTSYTSLENWVARYWCTLYKKKYYIGPVEPMNVHSVSVFRHQLRLLIFKHFVKKACGIAAMGNNALRMYRKVFSGEMVNVCYTFDHSDLLSKETLSPKEPLTFLYSGRLSAFRNPILVVESFAALVKLFPDVEMRLIMSGRGELYQSCIERIAKLKISGHVTWINEFSSWKDIHTLYQKAHVLLALQHYSTWGIIIQEAMAAGMGIIASRTIEAADNLIIDDYNGYLISMTKMEAINAMKNYILNRDLVRLHGDRSKEVVATVDLSKQTKKFLSLICDESSLDI